MEREKNYTVTLPQAACAQHFAMDAGEDVGEAPPAGRPAPLFEVLPQVRVLRRTVEQIGDVVPLVPALADSMPQMVDQLVAVLARHDMPFSDQIIEVPKVSCSERCGRTVLCTPQTAEQLVEVPTILTPSFLRMLQNVDTPVPGGSLHGLSVSGSSISSAVSRDVRGDGFFALFPGFWMCDTTSALWVGTAPALEPMDAGSL